MLENIPCAICGARQTHRIYTKFNLDIAQCTRCGLVYSTPRLSREDIWKRYSPDYFWGSYMPALGVRDGQFDLEHFDHYYKSQLATIAARHPPPGRMLEVGAGAGFFIKAAERQGWVVAGVEVSHEGITFAREQLGLDVRAEAAEDLNFPAHSFDVVVMLEVIEHLLDPHEVLARVHRVLRPGGLLTVSTPNFDSMSRVVLGKDWSVLSPGEHLYYFTEKTLARLLEKTGFGKIHFAHSAFGVFDTMNSRNTHAPQSLKSRAYFGFVSGVGALIFRLVQSRAKGDLLLCFAQAM